MALIKCSECNNQISDKAAACPQCGCPIAVVQKGVSVYDYPSTTGLKSSNDQSNNINHSKGVGSEDEVTFGGCLLLIGGIIVLVGIVCLIFIPHIGWPLLTIVAIGRVLVYANKNKYK